MSLKQVADETVAALEKILRDSDLSDEQKQSVAQIIEQSLAKTVKQTAKAHHQATVVCCGPEADMAHKISEEVKRANALLTSNLMALR